MEVAAPPGAQILLNGNRHDRSVRWSDSDDGTKVYVGAAVARSSSNFIEIVDPALPHVINDALSESLPKIMRYLDQRLPSLAKPPMLFVSYDPAYNKGHGRQGGTLPNQIFMHFYGPIWSTADSVDNTPEDVVWFFAHEAGHLFQHGVTGDRESAWIHEGAAEAFAYFLLRDLGIVSEGYLDTRRLQAFNGCRDALGNGVLAGAADRRSFSTYYQCGLIMFIAMNRAIRGVSDDQQDLFNFWRALISEAEDSRPLDTVSFLSLAEPWIGQNLAKQLLSLSANKQDNADEALLLLGR